MSRRFIYLCVFATVYWLTASNSSAQNGDKKGEIQNPLPSHVVIPAAPPLDVDAALKSFKIQPGFDIQVVASEPLVETPVEIEFGPDGRLWVVEMRGYMPNVDGKGEDQPNGQISVLEDTDGDGKMDKKTVFLDQLILPRALALVHHGVLVAEPPNLWFCQDTNRDDHCDTKILVSKEYGNIANPEHSSNGLMVAMDNWIYSANHTNRLRLIKGQWVQQETPFRGQWGLTQDDEGRFFYNSNSDQLRADLVWGDYYLRRAGQRSGFGSNHQVVKDQAVWPARVNPGVNRGYQNGQLKPDGRLATFTGACGPCIYRGDQFPEPFQGAAFLCEPTGNFVRCNILSETDGMITATNAFPGSEFLASTDERFRPVNIINGLDGNLYLVDMYRGVLQHRVYLTTYLRNQSLSRNLQAPVNMGRIYRITRSNQPRTRAPNLAKSTSDELVQTLSSPNGWARDTAQRLLIERGTGDSVGSLRQVATHSDHWFARIHALWALEGLGALDAITLEQSLQDKDERLRLVGLRLSEPQLRTSDSWLQKIDSSQKPSSTREEAQRAFTIGALPESAPVLAREKRGEILRMILRRNPNSPLVKDAAFSSLSGDDLTFLEKWIQTSGGRKTAGFDHDAGVVQGLAKMTGSVGKGSDIERLLDLAVGFPEFAPALLSGLWGIQPPTKTPTAKPARIIQLTKEPKAWSELKLATNLVVAFNNVDRMLHWPGKVGGNEQKRSELSADEKKLFEDGKALYQTICGSCHQPHGLGQDGLAPALADSEWVTGSPQRLVRIALQGVRGPITVKGKLYEMDMPGLGVLEDEQLAALLTYVRNEWGHRETAVSVGQVAKIRLETQAREEAWKADELEKIP